ncbi:hypothetical protein ASC72_13025 [Flavobacterium sp. Root420]|nr:hypothetical protein ASC72_13025 [Flavobacterium sp. Root420]
MIVTSFELSNTFWLIIKCDVWLGKYTKSEFICWGVEWGNIFFGFGGRFGDLKLNVVFSFSKTKNFP